MKNIVQIIFNTVVPVLVVVAALMGFRALVAGREAPDRERPPDRGMLVQVDTAEPVREPVTVTADGVVVAARQVVIQPQVAGRIDHIHPQLVVGGLIPEGDRIFSLEDRDYGIAVDEARAAVAQAEAQLEIERGRQRVAAREWEIFRSDAPEGASSALATREPQVRSAEIAVELAQARLQRTRLERSRTSLDAPFSGLVIRENAELGQLASSASQLATIVGTDAFWIEVAVPLAALDAIEVPGTNSVDGSAVLVTQRGSSGDVLREGRVIRLLGEMSQVGRMARLVVAVDDPLGLDVPLDERRTPLLLGAYVSVALEGATIENVVAIPRTALHDGNLVYVAHDGELQIREVDIAWRRADEVYVRSGIEPGERFIVSPVAIAVDGMRIRVEGDERTQGANDA